MTKLTISDADFANLKGKVVVVTGGSSGIGHETIKKLLSAGAEVVNGDLNPPAPDTSNGSSHFIPVDVTAWDQLSALFEQTIELHGRIDHVFANAGIGATTNFLDGDKFDDKGKLLEPNFRTIDINLKAAINTVYLAFHYMKKQETGGSVVITASASSFQRLRAVDYTISKHGVLGLMRGLVPLTYPNLPLRINVVAPDWTATGIVSPDFLKAIKDLGQKWQTADVAAKSVALLMADGTRHGQVIYSAGGEYQEIEEMLQGVAKEVVGDGPTLDATFDAYVKSLSA